jgi:hypothetical protein
MNSLLFLYFLHLLSHHKYYHISLPFTTLHITLSQLFAEIVPNAYRVVNKHDFVPKFPASSWWNFLHYGHVGKVINVNAVDPSVPVTWFEKAIEFLPETLQDLLTGKVPTSHLRPSYYEAVGRAAGSEIKHPISA